MISQKKLILFWRRWACVVLALVMLLGLAGCGGEKREPLRAPTGIETVSIETNYGALAFPKELYDRMRHMEVTEDSTAIEIFYMVSAENEWEVFRIYFADSQAGNHMGYLTTDSGEIPVSYALCEYADEDFATEEERELYYSMMDAFSVVINSIHADERFSENRAVAPVSDREVQLRYWKIMLPDNVQYTETEENGNYRAVFYGQVSGERIDLYMIGLGDLEAETTLGLYTADGVQKPVQVETYSLAEYELWPEEERNVIYQMMTSVNTVIQTIVTDENFTEPEPGE